MPKEDEHRGEPPRVAGVVETLVRGRARYMHMHMMHIHAYIHNRYSCTLHLRDRSGPERGP
eukprot:1415632-Prymnesium_polylepis.2